MIEFHSTPKSPVMYFPMRDFPVFRIACQNNQCKAVTEISPVHVEALMKRTGARCPVCNHEFTQGDVEGGADVVTMMAKVVLALSKLGSHVTIELPVKGVLSQ